MRLLAILIVVFFAVPAAASPSGKQIIDHVLAQPSPEYAQVEIEMNLTGNHSGTRRLVTYVKQEDGRTSTVVRFQEPADYRGAGILALEADDGSVERWIRLQGQRRVRRLPSGSQSGAFLNTDFSYEDFDGQRNDPDARHKLLREETIDGHEAYVVESTPGKDSGSAYRKVIQWVRKDGYVPVRVDFYQDGEEPVKRLVVEELKQIDGYWISTKSKMTTLARGTNTELRIVESDFSSAIPSSTFSRRFLQE